jgi:2,4-dienoyl-CoA reductase-like NADH-dependent reductase (Old Yellow Enzyme family)
MAPVYTGWLFNTKEYATFYLKRVKGGIGLLIMPVPTYGGFEDLGKKEFQKAAELFVKTCHSYDCKVIPQIFSGVGEEVNKISGEELDKIPERYSSAALMAKQAGFDGFEVHGAHHSLFMHLLSPTLNKRDDKYGKTFENRIRIQIQTIEAIRKKVGPEFPLFIRFSASDFVENGVDLSNTIPYAKQLENAGIDCLDISAGGTPISPPYSMSPDESKLDGCFADLAFEIKKNVSIPVIVAGKIGSRSIAEEILQSGKADLIAVCRQLLSDPEWPNKLSRNEDLHISRCLYCNTGCFHQSTDKGIPIRCVKNSEVGFEHEHYNLVGDFA